MRVRVPVANVLTVTRLRALVEAVPVTAATGEIEAAGYLAATGWRLLPRRMARGGDLDA